LLKSYGRTLPQGVPVLMRPYILLTVGPIVVAQELLCTVKREILISDSVLNKNVRVLAMSFT